ncbi:hypothetical protein [Mesorhizobium sp. M8A.F.Ca.ET.165.01.1.1]|uniref:hypothetical protein n=1 Tax=Mesorhizobium sp. M8A.F.Ca.ET.165.01.1.1 TaxID=2563960 RepID=UPI001093FC5D|nr:hypothetical protein [Mesorhizobium sp. M8A.F.Ca.ET.165.01.1.1]TGT42831.1 hypothetical protein EN808_13210 [Mesorhizobium sp. M8A.F.Ca.ET.165.01.1.1]
MSIAGDKFDWNGGEEVVIREQRAIAVYRNPNEGIVIREQGGWDEDGDMFIVLTTAGAAYRLIDAIKRELDDLKAEKKGDAS